VHWVDCEGDTILTKLDDKPLPSLPTIDSVMTSGTADPSPEDYHNGHFVIPTISIDTSALDYDSSDSQSHSDVEYGSTPSDSDLDEQYTIRSPLCTGLPTNNVINSRAPSRGPPHTGRLPIKLQNVTVEALLNFLDTTDAEMHLELQRIRAGIREVRRGIRVINSRRERTATGQVLVM